MQLYPKEKRKRYKINGKRSLLTDKRSFFGFEILPFYGRIGVHIALIVAYVLYEIITNHVSGYAISFWLYMPYYAILVGAFYFNSYILFPTIYRYRKSIWKPCLFFILEISLLISILLLMNHTLRYFLTGELSLRTHKQTLINTIWRSVYISMISGAHWLFLHALEQKRKEVIMLKRQQEAERKELVLQIAYENARINPHFLFNTLQFVYRDIAKISPKSEYAIAGLSDMLRYAFAPVADDGKVALLEELGQVSRFLDLNRQRLAEQFYFTYHEKLPGDMSDLRLPPHLILSIVENMIKHGVTDTAGKEAMFNIEVKENGLIIEARNHRKINAKAVSTGLGMSNLRTRLQYLYPDRHQLQIETKNDIYILKMNILL